MPTASLMRDKIHTPTRILYMTLNHQMVRLLGNAEYLFFDIIPRFTQTRIGSTYEGPMYWSNRIV